MENLGGRIRAERKRRGLTIVDVCELTGLSQGCLSKVERGVANPTISVLDRIAAAVGLEITVRKAA